MPEKYKENDRVLMKYWPTRYSSYFGRYVRHQIPTHGEFIRKEGSWMEWVGSYSAICSHRVDDNDVIEILKRTDIE